MNSRSAVGRYCFRSDRVIGYESGWVLAHQLCLLNSITGREFKEEFKVTLRNKAEDISVQSWLASHRLRLWQGKNLDRELLGRALQSDALVDRVDKDWECFRYDWSVFGVRYCPRCLRQGVHLSMFQFPWTTRCPYHGIPLQQNCPQCRLEIDYVAPNEHGPFSCKCGHQFWAPRTVADWRIDPVMRNTLAEAGAAFERMHLSHSAERLLWSFHEKRLPRQGQAVPRNQYPWCTTHTLATVWALVEPKKGRLANNFDESVFSRITSKMLTVSRVRRRDAIYAVKYRRPDGRATYKAICRHLYRKVLIRHRRSIRAIASFCHDPQGRMPRGLRLQFVFDPAAMTFVLWKCLWEWRHPDEIYRSRRREISWKWERHENELFYEDGNTSECLHEVGIDESDREILRGALHHRYVATRCMASFDEIAARIEAVRRTKSVHFLPLNMVDWRYMPTMAVVLYKDVSCVVHSFWPAEPWLNSPIFEQWLRIAPSALAIEKYLTLARRPIRAWRDHGEFKWPKNGREGVYFLEGPSTFRHDNDYWV